MPEEVRDDSEVAPVTPNVFDKLTGPAMDTALEAPLCVNVFATVVAPLNVAVPEAVKAASVEAPDALTGKWHWNCLSGSGFLLWSCLWRSEKSALKPQKLSSCL